MDIKKDETLNEIGAEIEALTEEVEDALPEASNNLTEDSAEQEEEQVDGEISDTEGNDSVSVEEGEPEPDKNESEDMPAIGMLHEALDIIEDVFDRAMAPYITLGETARGLYFHNDPFYYTKEIHIGIRDTIYYDSVQRVLDELLPEPIEKGEDYIIMDFAGCTTRMDIVPRKHYFVDLDIRMYNYRNLPIPNPFTIPNPTLGYYEDTFGKKAEA